TAMTALSANPPPGVGPYTISSVTPNASFTLTKNPKFAGFHIPGIPTGSVDAVDVTIQSNNQTEAQQVLSNQADVFDPGDTLPPSLLAQVQSQASSRFAKQSVAVSYSLFLNSATKPVNNPMARQAVDLAFDRTAIERLSSGFLTGGCYFLPPTVPGHTASNSGCPGGDPTQAPSAADVAKAKQLVQQAGLAGTPVTVYSETRQPRQSYMEYYNSLLNQIGFKSTLKVIQDSVYFQTIGNKATAPQTGFADWSQDFPNPSDFYLLFDGRSIQPQNNENFGDVNDPHIQSELIKLNAVPATQISSVANEWASLDQFLTKNNYMVEMGYEQVPKFVSSRVNFSGVVFHPLYYWDWTSFKVK
ncbi:MAG: ABC transporter substrate-binding protein, partial [Acidimicrobiales bacterium]